MDRFRRELGFYSCTVSSFEQYTLARFLTRGYFEKHINRMRKFYRSRRNRVLEMLMDSPHASRMTIREEDAGLHFLVRLDTKLSDGELVGLCAGAGIRVRALSQYYHTAVPESGRHTLVVNYASVREEQLEAALAQI